MQPTTARPEKNTGSVESTDCENDWCDGPDSDTLPCFDPDHEYHVETDK